jgi:hypothetical protein
VNEIGNRIVEPAVFADQADERLARRRTSGGEDRRLDPEMSFGAGFDADRRDKTLK